MIELIDSLTFEINVSNILNTVVALILGAFITLWIVEGQKIKHKKAILINLLRKEVNAYAELEDRIIGEAAIGTPHRTAIFYTLLTSDVLNVKKDKELILALHEMVGWAENYNTLNNFANLSLIIPSDSSSQFFEGRDVLNYNSRHEVNRLKEILKKYK